MHKPSLPAVLGQSIEVPDGVSTELMGQLASELEQQLLSQGGKGIQDVTGVYVDPLTVTAIGSDAKLEWSYNNRGDYDLNGLVTVSDLTPIGVHFGKDSTAADWAAASCADGNGNGLIEVGDITPIGQNFNSSVENYVVEADIGGGDWRAVANVARTSGAAGAGTNWLQFSMTLGNGASAAAFRVYAGPAADPLYPLDPNQALFNPDNWVMYNVEDGPDIGTSDDSIAIGLVNGMPALVYVDTDRNRIRYARATVVKPASAADWITMTVDDSDTMGGEVDLIECYGVPCVTYQASTADNRYFAHAGTAEPNGMADWNSHELDWNVITVPQLAVSGGGHVAMVYKASGPSVTYAVANTAEGVPPAAIADWDTAVVDDSGSDFATPQLAFIQGFPIIAYQHSSSGHKELRYAYDDRVASQNSKSSSGLSMNWAIMTINDDDSNSGNDVELIVVDGNPVMSYRNIRIDEVLLMTMLDAPNPVNSGDWTTMVVRDETADRTDVGLQQALAWFNNRPFFLHIVSPVTASTLDITFANTETPAGPADFTSGVLFDPPGGVFVNGQNLAMVLPDGTLMIGYRTNEGLVFAYFEAP